VAPSRAVALDKGKRTGHVNVGSFGPSSSSGENRVVGVNVETSAPPPPVAASADGGGFSGLLVEAAPNQDVVED
jgi:hypothetical protein